MTFHTLPRLVAFVAGTEAILGLLLCRLVEDFYRSPMIVAALVFAVWIYLSGVAFAEYLYFNGYERTTERAWSRSMESNGGWR